MFLDFIWHCHCGLYIYVCKIDVKHLNFSFILAFHVLEESLFLLTHGYSSNQRCFWGGGAGPTILLLSVMTSEIISLSSPLPPFVMWLRNMFEYGFCVKYKELIITIISCDYSTLLLCREKNVAPLWPSGYGLILSELDVLLCYMKK